MASYIAWHGKKREQLSEQERDFLILLRSVADKPKLAQAAETVRAAQIRALKSKRAMAQPSEKNAIAMSHLNGEIKFWLGLSSGQIIAGYRTKKLAGHRSKAVRRAKA